MVSKKTLEKLKGNKEVKTKTPAKPKVKKTAKGKIAKVDQGKPKEAPKMVLEAVRMNTLRDILYLGPMKEGKGRKPGEVGNGLRRPYGALDEVPANIRQKVLASLLDEGFIITTDEGKYQATSMGQEYLEAEDICGKCNTPRKPYEYVVKSPGNGRAMQSLKIVAFYCDCQLKKHEDVVATGRKKITHARPITRQIDIAD